MMTATGRRPFSTLGDQQLLAQTKRLAANQRSLEVHILDHLDEIDRRQLALRRGFSSLFDYAVRELRFSDAAAQRRIQTMRLCRRHGPVRAMLHNGELSVTATAQMETAFAAAERACRRAIANVEQEQCHDLPGLPASGGHRAGARVPRPARRVPDRRPRGVERAAPVAQPEQRNQASVAPRLDALAAPSGYVRQAGPSGAPAPAAAPQSTSGGTEHGTDGAPAPPGVPPAPQFGGGVAVVHRAGGTPGGSVPRFSRAAARGPRRSPLRRPIPAAVRHHVWLRDGGRCCYRDPLSGRRCNSSHLLQIDHLLPVAEGGGPEPHNLALACFFHHRMRHGSGPAWLSEPSR